MEIIGQGWHIVILNYNVILHDILCPIFSFILKYILTYQREWYVIYITNHLFVSFLMLIAQNSIIYLYVC